jgi:hypothetical protein
MPAEEIELEGTVYRRIPYGSETIDGVDPFTTPCNVCGALPEANHSPKCSLGSGVPHRRPAKCRDCGVEVLSPHEWDCGVEHCPRCDHQFFSCQCNVTENSVPIWPED